MNIQSSPTLAINGVVADFGSETVRDKSGASIDLRPQAFAVLRYLSEHPDRLVTKDELMQAVWPGVAVTDDSLVQCVHEIRRALQDEERTVLKTVPKRGYRLVPPESGAVHAQSARRWAFAAGLAAVLAIGGVGVWWLARPGVPGGVPLVAVLPFDVPAGDADSRLLANGLTEDLITDLARFPEFQVLAGGATEGYRDAATEPRRIAAELGAGFVIEGSVAHQAERVRVTVQLFDAGSDSGLWSQRWDRPAKDFFAIQIEIAEEIANRLGGGAGLVQESGRIAARRKPPASLNAYELYLLGTERLEQVTLPEVEAALDLLTRAVEADPGLARAWIELYHTNELLADHGVEPERNRALGEAAAARALALDPSDPEAHAVYGGSLGMRGDFARAEAEFETAMRMAPNAAEILIFYIGWASSFGKAERGAGLVERAIRLDPYYPTWANRPFALANFMAGRYGEAVTFFDRFGTEKHNRWSWAAHAGALAAAGRREEATALVVRALAAHPDLSIELMANEPGWTDAEHARFIETMRLAGFPPCAAPEALTKIVNPLRLPECEARENATPPLGENR